MSLCCHPLQALQTFAPSYSLEKSNVLPQSVNVYNTEQIAHKTDTFIRCVKEKVFHTEDVGSLQKILRLVQNGEITAEEIPLVKSRGYLSRFWSGENWLEWAENRTPLGRIISKYCEYATSNVILETFMQALDPEVIKIANRDAASVLQTRKNTEPEFPASINLASINQDSGVVFEGSKAFEQIGWSIDVAKNFRGDNVPALLLGSTTRGYTVFFGQNSSQPIILNKTTSKDVLIFEGVSGMQDETNPFKSGSSVNSNTKSTILLGAPLESCAYVIFGQNKALDKTFDVAKLNGENGFSVCDKSKNEALGQAVCICDVNADGIGDSILAAPGDYLHAPTVGKVYVIFGSSNEQDKVSSFNLTSLNGTNGFEIHGAKISDYFGYSVACMSDWDKQPSLLIGSPGHNNNAGAVYVVYGRKGPFTSPMKVSNLPQNEGFAIYGSSKDDAIGQVVIEVDDMNADGLKDIGIATDTANKIWVVFGVAGIRPDFNISVIDGKNGFGVEGTNKDPQGATGFACSLSSGKINSDPIGDLIAGACVASPGGINNAGQSYVIYGHKGPWEKKMLVDNLNGTNGFTINGAYSGDISGSSVGNIGDYNFDGVNDIAIGAPGASSGASPGGIQQAGRVYIVYGKRTINTSPPENTVPIGSLAGPIVAGIGLAALLAIGTIAVVRHVKQINSRSAKDPLTEDTPLVPLE